MLNAVKFTLALILVLQESLQFIIAALILGTNAGNILQLIGRMRRVEGSKASIQLCGSVNGGGLLFHRWLRD